MIDINKNLQNFNNSIVLSTTNTKVFLFSLHLANYFKTLLYKKNILVTQFNLNINSNRIDLSLHLYFRKKKLIKFKKTKLRKKTSLNKKNILFFILKNLNSFFKSNTLELKVKVLNKLIIFPFLFKSLNKKIKYFKKSLFERRLNLYFDFLRITVLYQTSQIKLDTFLLIIGEIFQRLIKKKHGQFLKFIKVLFKDILLKNKYKNKKIYNTIKGARFILSGKIRGKLRAKTVSIYFGSIPISTLSKNVQFSKLNIFTFYGTYGIKLWIYQQLSTKKNFDKILSKISFKKIKFLKRKGKLNGKKKFNNYAIRSKSFKIQKKSKRKNI